MKIVIAPDSFKGSLSALEVSECVEKGVKSVLPFTNVVKLPLSDGGEGLVDALVASTGGEYFQQEVTGPLGEKILAKGGLLGDQQTAVIEMAAASGLPLVPAEKRDPRHTTTYGTGELIKEAMNKGCRRIIVGIGGSATNDGGAGMAQALGFRLLNHNEKDILPGGANLSSLQKINCKEADYRISKVEIQVACDVNNPLTGPKGAAHVYGPQKGATPEMVKELDRNLSHYANIVHRDLQIEVDKVPGAGAAGGLGAGLMAFLGGKLVSGIELVIGQVSLEQKLDNCSLVITGEGNLDEQSLYGKVPVGVARLAKKRNIPVVAITGSHSTDTDMFRDEGITACFNITNRPMSLEEAIQNTAPLMESTVREITHLIKSQIKV